MTRSEFDSLKIGSKVTYAANPSEMSYWLIVDLEYSYSTWNDPVWLLHEIMNTNVSSSKILLDKAMAGYSWWQLYDP